MKPPPAPTEGITPPAWRRPEKASEWPLRIAQLLWLAWKDLFTDNGPQWAAAISYYAVLSLFPLLLALTSVAANFVDPEWAITRAAWLIREFVPEGEALISATVRQAVHDSGPAGWVSALVLLWSGSRVFATLTQALNVAYDVDEPYRWRARLLIDVLMLLSVGLLFLLAVSSAFWLGLLWRVLGLLPHQRDFLFQSVKSATLPALLLTTFYVVYRHVPRSYTDRAAALAGAVSAVLLFMVARPLFVYYIQKLARYNLIYGSLSIVVVLLVWAWLVSVIILLGGEIASHVQMLWFEGRTAAEVVRIHEENAGILPVRHAMPGRGRTVRIGRRP
ncbi:MAG: ribonuclease [Armatimonadetes bacterium]|jgi:membrane protein|nr:ribonuclease [Armatimonadota bacterium]